MASHRPVLRTPAGPIVPHWYDREWVRTLISVLFGALVTYGIELFRVHQERVELRRSCVGWWQAELNQDAKYVDQDLAIFSNSSAHPPTVAIPRLGNMALEHLLKTIGRDGFKDDDDFTNAMALLNDLIEVNAQLDMRDHAKWSMDFDSFPREDNRTKAMLLKIKASLSIWNRGFSWYRSQNDLGASKDNGF